MLARGFLILGDHVKGFMSRAFVKETEGEWLGDVEPEIAALERFLTKENGGIKVARLRSYNDPETGRAIHEMSNGDCYSLDEDNRWRTV